MKRSSSKIIQLIHTTEIVGNGTTDKPMQEVSSLFTLEGELVAREFAEFEGANLNEFYPREIRATYTP